MHKVLLQEHLSPPMLKRSCQETHALPLSYITYIPFTTRFYDSPACMCVCNLFIHPALHSIQLTMIVKRQTITGSSLAFFKWSFVSFI